MAMKLAASSVVGKVFFVSGLLALVFAWGSTFAQGGIGAFSKVSVTSPLRSEFKAAPGETRSGHLTIRNDGAEPATVAITQSDFSLDRSGEILYVGPYEQRRSNLDWIEVGNQVTVPAQGSVDLSYTIEVPTDASLSGTYWGMMVVEPADSTTFVDEDDGGHGVRTSVSVSFRYAVTLLVHVGEPEERNVLFSEPQFTGDAENYRLGVTLENPGEHLLQGELWLELYDNQGAVVKRIDLDRLRIYPQAARRQRFDLGELEEGDYQAVVVVDAGGDDVFGARYTLPVTDSAEGGS